MPGRRWALGRASVIGHNATRTAGGVKHFLALNSSLAPALASGFAASEIAERIDSDFISWAFS